MHPRRAFVAAIAAAIGHVLAQDDHGHLFLATSMITETVWTICGVIETTTVYEPAGCITTSIPMPNGAVLSSVTIQPSSSPTSVYNLPTPASSMEVAAFGVNQLPPPGSPSRRATRELVDPVFFYLGDNATTPEYIGSLFDGVRVLLDLSSSTLSSGGFGLVLPDGDSLLFDQAGIHHFAAGGASASSVVIPAFLDQLVGANQSPPAQPNTTRDRSIGEVKSTINFTVSIQVQQTVSDQLQEPRVFYGDSECELLAKASNGPGGGGGTDPWDTLSWTCQHPGAQSGQKVCEEGFQSWIGRPIPNTPGRRDIFAGAITGLGSSLFAAVTNLFNNTVNDGASVAPRPGSAKSGSDWITSLFPSLPDPLLKALPWLSKAREGIIDVVELGGEEAVCEILHAGDEHSLIMSDPGLSTLHTIGVYVSPPVPTIVETLIPLEARTSMRKTKEPPRAVIPGAQGFPSVTATTFPVVSVVNSFASVIASAAASGGKEVHAAQAANSDMEAEGLGVRTKAITLTETDDEVWIPAVVTGFRRGDGNGIRSGRETKV